MPDPTLLMLLDEVRSKTLRRLDAVPAEMALWTPPGLQNHILWHAGHSLVTVESLAMRALGRDPQIPDGWAESFAMGSRPAEIPADGWPPLAEVVAALREQHERLRVLIGGLTEDQLDRPSAHNPDRTVRYALLHGLHDEACHSGEAYLLFKMRSRS